MREIEKKLDDIHNGLIEYSAIEQTGSIGKTLQLLTRLAATLIEIDRNLDHAFEVCDRRLEELTTQIGRIREGLD